MPKPIIALFFFTVFTTTVLAPTIILMVDDGFDVSMFYNITEEEKKEKGADGKKDILYSNYLNVDYHNVFYVNQLEHSYRFSKYNTPYINLISPPPDTTSIS